MAIEKTIGSAGDYPGLIEAYEYICGLGALAFDYDFDLLETVNIGTWPSISLQENRVDHNNHTVRIHCSFNEANPKRPDLWKKFTLGDGIIWCHDTGTNDLLDKVILHHLFFEDNGIHQSDTMFNHRSWSSDDGCNSDFHHLWFTSDSQDATALVCSEGREYINWDNIAVYNLWNGLYVGGSYSPGDTFPGRKKITNCSVFKVGNWGMKVDRCPGYELVVKNVWSRKDPGASGAARDWAQTDFGGTSSRELYNCVDNDNSIVTELSGSISKVNCRTGLNVANECKSNNISDLGDGFLELKDGEYQENPDGSRRFWPGSDLLGATGISSQVKEDIYGRPRPGVSGIDSIGAFQQVYELRKGIWAQSFKGDLKLNLCRGSNPGHVITLPPNPV